MNNGTNNKFRMSLQMERHILEYTKDNGLIEVHRKFHLKLIFKVK